jgi:hypothetical protein
MGSPILACFLRPVPAKPVSTENSATLVDLGDCLQFFPVAFSRFGTETDDLNTFSLVLSKT